MRFYQATRFIFPRSYAMRIFTICFISAQVPLIGLALAEVMLGEWQRSILVPLLVAIVAGTGLGLAGLWGLMAPLRVATRDLIRLGEGRLVEDVPEGGPDMAGQLLHAVARAARETRSRMGELRTEAGTDMLTGLLNRRGFEETVAAVLRGGGGGTLALIDGDRFRQVNDELGHAAGDTVLCGLARRLIGNMRGGDIAARWGGDEFVVFFTGLGEADAEQIVQRIHDAVLAAPDAVIGGKPAGFSWGLATMERRRGDTLDAAMRIADARLYERKTARRAA